MYFSKNSIDLYNLFDSFLILYVDSYANSITMHANNRKSPCWCEDENVHMAFWVQRFIK